MERKVFKYSVPVDDKWHEISMPPSFPEVLHVGCQGGLDTVQFWVEVQVGDVKHHLRSFRVFGTGHPIPDDAIYQGSVIAVGGVLVWHLYEDWVDDTVSISAT